MYVQDIHTRHTQIRPQDIHAQHINAKILISGHARHTGKTHRQDIQQGDRHDIHT